jgi:hypothetical protein
MFLEQFLLIWSQAQWTQFVLDRSDNSLDLTTSFLVSGYRANESKMLFILWPTKSINYEKEGNLEDTVKVKKRIVIKNEKH